MRRDSRPAQKPPSLWGHSGDLAACRVRRSTPTVSGVRSCISGDDRLRDPPPFLLDFRPALAVGCECVKGVRDLDLALKGL